MTILVIWILLSIGAGAVASAKGRSGFGYFLLALVLSPLIGFIIAACIPSLMYVDTTGVRRRVHVPGDPTPEESRNAKRVIAILVLIGIGVAATTWATHKETEKQCEWLIESASTYKQVCN